jgi:hypothetical protein
MPNSLVKSFAKKHNMSIEKVEKMWDLAVKKAEEHYKKEDERFYPYVVGILKRMLNEEMTSADIAPVMSKLGDTTVQKSPSYPKMKVFSFKEFLNYLKRKTSGTHN